MVSIHINTVIRCFLYKSSNSKILALILFFKVSALGDIAFDAILPFLSEYASTTIHVFGTNKTEWSQALLKQIPADQLFITYGGTKYIKKETKRLELAL